MNRADELLQRMIDTSDQMAINARCRVRRRHQETAMSDDGGMLVRSNGKRERRFRWLHLRYEFGRRIGYAFWAHDGMVAGGFTVWKWESP